MMSKEINNMDEEIYKLTPMGIALYCLLECKLLVDPNDPRFNRFWTMFVEGMEKNAYVQTEDDYDFK